MICIIHREHDPLYSLRKDCSSLAWRAAKQPLGRICETDGEGAARNGKACAAGTNRTHSRAWRRRRR
jgi:hypothetical protein